MRRLKGVVSWLSELVQGRHHQPAIGAIRMVLDEVDRLSEVATGGGVVPWLLRVVFPKIVRSYPRIHRAKVLLEAALDDLQQPEPDYDRAFGRLERAVEILGEL